MGFILFLIAILIGSILIPLGLFYGFIKCFWKRQPLTGISNLNYKFLSLAIALDIYGNTICPELLGDFLLTSSTTHPYGSPGETISEATAVNYLEHTLTPIGKGLAWILILCGDSAFPTKDF